MRLRLDKLVLSAGLALAMVATTIPVMPVKAATATAGIYSGSTEVTLGADFAATVTGVKTTGTSNVNDTIVKTENVGTVTAGTLNATPSANSEATGVTNYLTKNGLTAVEASTITPFTAGVIVTQQTTYAMSGYSYTSVETDENETTAKASAVTAAKTVMEGVAGEAKVGTATPEDYGTKQVTVAASEALAATADSENPETYTAKTSKYTVAGTYTVTTTYTITDLTSFGYTAKYTVPGVAAANSGKNIYKVLKLTDATNGGIDITEVTSTSADETVTFEVTDDLTAKYMVAYSVESTSDALITGKTDVDGYTIKIAPSDGTDDATAKYLIDEYISSNGYTKVSYLNITVKDSNNEAVEESTTDFTFTIDVPTDIGTDGITYTVLRMHNGVVEPLTTTVADGVITFTSNKFSDFALVYGKSTTDTIEEATDTTTDSTTTDSATDATTDSTSATTADSSTTSTTASEKTGDNSMMPLFMTTLLLALCAGSLAIYKEKKTN